jgi:hypothetical protein
MHFPRAVRLGFVSRELAGTLDGQIWRRDKNADVCHFSVFCSVWVERSVMNSAGSGDVGSWLPTYKSSYLTSVFLDKRTVNTHFDNMRNPWMPSAWNKKHVDSMRHLHPSATCASAESVSKTRTNYYWIKETLYRRKGNKVFCLEGISFSQTHKNITFNFFVCFYLRFKV